MGFPSRKRFAKSSRSSRRATGYLAERRTRPSAPGAESHSELKATRVSLGSRILKTCALYVSAFATTSSFVSCGRVAFLPVGSPIIPVKSPIRKMTVWPRRWKCRIFRKTTVCPRWRSGVDGSNPTFTTRGLPVFTERASFFSSSSRFSHASTPFRRRSSCSGTGGKALGLTRRIVGDRKRPVGAARASFEGVQHLLRRARVRAFRVQPEVLGKVLFHLGDLVQVRIGHAEKVMRPREVGLALDDLQEHRLGSLEVALVVEVHRLVEDDFRLVGVR